MDKNRCLREWKETINNMSYEELQRSIGDPNIHPEFKKLAKEKVAEQEYNNIGVDPGKAWEVFLKALKKKRWKYELTDDVNKVIFTKRNKAFFAYLDWELDYVTIYFIHSIIVNIEDEARLSLLRKAINAANSFIDVTTFYDKSVDESEIIVLSKSTINFIIDNPCFEKVLEIALERCLHAEILMKGFMKRINKEMKRMTSHTPMTPLKSRCTKG